ncbi:MAG TPA: hypothetical protein VLZ81_15980 [Blastocatellia bacterium]|nr:hypothetical protein [Blastocatellia bacterium]
MAEMACMEFEAMLGDYVGRELDVESRKSVAEHSLKCLGCRKLLDDVKNKLNESESEGGVGALPELDHDLETIPRRHGSLNCSDFQELVTEFLDGFVPAPIYHKFVAHSDQCDDCSGVLTGVVYAVAACHSVHMYEELETPSGLCRNLLEIPCLDNPEKDCAAGRDLFPTLAGAAAGSRFGRLIKAARAVTRHMPPALPGYATASGLIAASIAMMMFGSPSEFGWLGVYHRAQARAVVADRTAVEAYSQEEEGPSRLDQVESDISQAWKTVDATRVRGLVGGPSSAMKQRTPGGGLTTSIAGK